METNEQAWYKINGVEKIDSPALVIYADRVRENIERLISSIDYPARLRPHVKTHKSIEVTRMLMEAGIVKFKCATIAEAEMLAICGAKDVLLAYQPCGPKLHRFVKLIHKYPESRFSCLVDDGDIARQISVAAVNNGLIVPIYIDLNVGMNRTGIEPEKGRILGEIIKQMPNVKLEGLHAYDGHIEDLDLQKLTERCMEVYQRVSELKHVLQSSEAEDLNLVLGGSPTFPIYAKLQHVECSPGTFVFWDQNYLNALPDQDFKPAALLIGRIISKPCENRVTIDIGHKAVSSEYPLNRRVKFLNAPEFQPVSHSEEHLVMELPANSQTEIGAVLYGVPYHVCPTCALHEEAIIVENHEIIGNWKIIARNRFLTV